MSYKHIVNVDNRIIEIVRGREFVEDNAYVDVLHADFDECWDDCEIAAVFTPSNGESVRTQFVDGMEVPPEVLANPGWLHLTFIGTKAGNVVIETAMQAKPFVVSKAGVVDGADPAPPTPSEYQQLMAEISRIRADIEAGLLKGDKGDDGKDADIAGAEAAKNAANEAAALANANANLAKQAAEYANSVASDVDSAIDQAENASLTALLSANAANDAAQAARDADANATAAASNANEAASEIRQRADSGEFDGEAGHSPVITASKSGNVTTVYADGVQIAQIPDGAPGSDASATDVRINGSSIVVDGVADIPIANGANYGVTRPYNGLNFYGINSSQNGLYLEKASNSDIDARTNGYRPIVSNNLDYAVKAAMCDGKGVAWIESERMNARKRMGVASCEWEKIVEFEPDGTTMFFVLSVPITKAVIVFDLAPLSTANRIALQVNDIQRYAHYFDQATGSGIRRAITEISCESGLVLAKTANTAFNTNNATTWTASFYQNTPIETNVINKLVIGSVQSAEPTGGKITVYGIKA